MELYKDITEWGLPLSHEKELIEYIYHKLPSKLDTFIDIGANVGTWPLNLNDVFDKIIAFEPFIDSRYALLENLRLNNITNTEVHEYALSNIAGYQNLTYFKTGGHSTLLREHPISDCVGEKVGEILVPCAPLDIFLEYAKHGKIDLIKIDTEGSEVAIVEGALKTINKHKPKLIIEIHDIFDKPKIKDMLPMVEFEEYKWAGQTYLLSL